MADAVAACSGDGSSRIPGLGGDADNNRQYQLK